ncbi:MFS transporter [Paraglaciecola arctica]|uniref:MFS transporter n=1 Tax=Paraglaciecola arctica TaxID=1128911 RepID=UPI001C07AA98|nr:MFS transporter [Paraglaciecola arctica]MBU3004638.1 MFS transporter [Paraglaciecola arctica]
MMKKQVSNSTKAFFGLGSLAAGIKENAFGVFLIFFYTQVVGLSGSLAGAAVLCALIFDAISDPLVGHWSDNFSSKWGRRHPFMYASVIPVALCFYCLFSPPTDMSQGLTFLWMVVFAVGIRLSITFYVIPSSSMMPEMTTDYNERTQLTSIRVIFSWVGAILISYLAYSWLFIPSAEFEDGRFDINAYKIYGLVGAIAILLSILISTLGTHRLIPQLQKGSQKGFSFKHFFQDFAVMLKNKTFVILFVSVLVASISSGVLDVFTLYINTYFWGFSSQDLSKLLIGSALGAIIAFVGIKFLGRKFDKKHMFMAFVVMAIVFGPIPVAFRLLGLVPENGTPFILFLIMGSSLFTVLSGVGAIVLAGSMLADTIDLQYLETGQRQEGLHYSAFAFSAKATTGLGGFIGGVTLDLISFPKEVSIEAISPQALTSLGIANVLLVSISLGATLFLISKYSLTKEKHAQIVKELQQLKQQPQTSQLGKSPKGLDQNTDIVAPT